MLACTAGHNHQPRFAGANVTARHRRVERREAPLVRRRRDPPREHRTRSRHVDEQCPGFGALDDAACAEVARFHVGRKPQHGDHHVGLGRRCASRIVPDCTAVEQRLGLFFRPIVNMQAVARFLKMAGHAAAHDTGANKCDRERSGHDREATG